MDETDTIFARKEDVDWLQEQIYIVAGVLGGVSLIILILVIVLSVMISKLQKALKTQTSPHPVVPAGPPISAYPIANKQVDEVASRFAQYPPVAPPQRPTVSNRPLNAPYREGNDSGSVYGYESNSRPQPGVQVLPQQAPARNYQQQGRQNPAFVDDRNVNINRTRSSNGYDYGY